MFTGTIARVQSMADGSPRFVIDAGEFDEIHAGGVA